MHDGSTPHFVDELAKALRNGPGRDRQVHVVLENDLNDAARLARDGGGAPQLADAQWNDDVHHTLHVATTGERDGYYIDFADQPLRLFGRALAEGFAYQGDASVYRHGERRGTVSTQLPPLAFVNSLQTHDQVGNRAFGDRLQMLAAGAGREDTLRALLACVLLAPSPPMLFMGEEYAAGTPFQYFCDFDGELAKAVTEGRRAEFGRFARFIDPAVRERIPDPNAVGTFDNSRLDWNERGRADHAAWLSLYATLLRRRREMLLPWLAAACSGHFSFSAPGLLRISWPLAEGRRWHLLAQLADEAVRIAPAEAMAGESVYASHGTNGAMAPWSVRFTLEHP
jgi:maltooligosyltrehalose trehalohydrolase